MDFPQWVIDAQRDARTMAFGRVPLELVVAQGEVTKVVGTKNKSVQFKNRSIDEAILYVVDLVRSAVNADDPNGAKNGGTITFSITHKDKKVSLVNTFETVEYNYPM